MVEICAAHHIPYSATSSIANPKDIEIKVKKALKVKGPKYLQIHVPCPLGWRSDPSQSIDVAKKAVETGLYPIVEYEYGKLTKSRKISSPKPVSEYLKLQGRFRHLLKDAKALVEVQQVADKNIEYYGLK
jgi:pyruvate ferredoxin oxidoreductase beta subunit